MKVKNYLWTLAAALALVGCSDDLENQKGGPEEGTGNSEPGTLYIDFGMGMLETKASGNPNGGEDGDGFEGGTNTENAIKNVALFFLDSEKGGATLNTSDAEKPTVIGAMLLAAENGASFVKDASGTTWNYSKKVLIPKAMEEQIKFGKKYGVLAVANQFTSEDEIKTLTFEGLKDLTSGSALGDLSNGTDGFIMSSEEFAFVSFSQYNNSESEPARIKAVVEREVARIDYKANEEGNVYSLYMMGDNGELKQEDAYKYGEIELTDIAVVNQFKEKTVTFKRVSPENQSPDGHFYLADETYKQEGNYRVPTNFVKDLYFADKTLDANGEPNWNLRTTHYHNNVQADALMSTYFGSTKSFSLDPNKKEINDNNSDGWYDVCYVKENTTKQDAQVNGYSTGVVFKGTATLSKVLKLTEASTTGGTKYYDGYELASLAKDASFVIYDNRPYASLKDVQQLFVEKDFPSTNEPNDGFPTLSTGWQFDVACTTLMTTLATGKNHEDNLELLEDYLHSFKGDLDFGYYNAIKTVLDKAKEATAEAPYNWTKIADTEANWDVFEQNYKDELGKAENENTDTEHDIKISSNNTIECYYPYWIRHGNNGDPKVMGIMEFGIVRNNIYKLSVSAIKNFGPLELTPGAPDENIKNYIEVEVFVKPWVLRYNENIEL